MNAESYRKFSLTHSRSGLSIRAFCRKAGIPPWSFYYWRRRALATPLAKKDFVELRLKAESPTPLSDGFRLEFRGASLLLPPNALRQCLEILRDFPC